MNTIDPQLTEDPRHQMRSMLALIAVVAGLLGMFLWNFTRVTTWLRGPDASRLPVQTHAPDFEWHSANGTAHRLLDSAGPRGQVLLFVSSICPCSNIYADRFVAMLHKHQTSFHFLWINEDKVRLLDRHPTERLQKALVHLQQAGFAIDTIFDARDTIAHQYGARVTPEVFVLDVQGVIRYHGRIDDSQDVSKVHSHELEDALSAMEAGRDIPVKESQAVGCYIDDL